MAHKIFGKDGLSVIVSCQNEEHLVGACIVSFLRMADEIVVVDNGSADRSPEVCAEIAEAFPDRVRFYNRPELQHLYENRQYGFERTSYRWVLRADSDYVCYTGGEYDCAELRRFVAGKGVLPLPATIRVWNPTLRGDFAHTISETRPKGRRGVISGGDERLYRRFPGMRFMRLGRWEGVQLPKRITHVYDWPKPAWMHCDIKSELNYFHRSERTNWRELGDFETYPTVEDYIRKKVMPANGFATFEEAARQNLLNDVYTYIDPYDPQKSWEYPELVKAMMEWGCGYVFAERNGVLDRDYLGPPPVDKLIDFGRSIEFPQ